MMLVGGPPPTAADWHFRIHRFPVRVSPWFWLTMALFGMGSTGNGEPRMLLSWMVAAFLSVLCHELGHAWAYRWYGIESHLVLYQGGGLAIPYTSRGTTYETSRWRDVIVPAAGPVVQIASAIIIQGLFRAMGMGILPVHLFFLRDNANGSLVLPHSLLWLFTFLAQYISMSFAWAALNLLPILPMDGGVIARSLLRRWDERTYEKNSLVVSIAVAAGAALWALFSDRAYLAMLFGMFLFQNYQEFQANFASRGGYADRW